MSVRPSGFWKSLPSLARNLFAEEEIARGSGRVGKGVAFRRGFGPESDRLELAQSSILAGKAGQIFETFSPDEDGPVKNVIFLDLSQNQTSFAPAAK